jgi:hypothetical protein
MSIETLTAAEKHAERLYQQARTEGHAKERTQRLLREWNAATEAREAAEAVKA